jgi:hypothetical protein
MSPKPKILTNRHRNAISDKKSNTAEKPPGRIHNNDKKTIKTAKKPLEHTLNVGPTDWKWSQQNKDGEVSLKEQMAASSEVWTG